MTLSPIALFTYNRLAHTKRTVESLLRNEEAKFSKLIIFSDGAKSPEAQTEVSALRDYIRSISGFHSISIIEREHNLGLAESLIRGVSEMLTKEETVIVMEDDLIVSKFFLSFMNTGLKYFLNESQVASIHGWNFRLPSPVPDTFFLRGADCWGWATWRRAWKHFNADGSYLLEAMEKNRLTRIFDLDGAYPYTQMLRDQIAGKNKSWAIRWHASAFLKNMLTLYPGESLVQNIGQDNSGVHSGPNPVLETDIVEKALRKFPDSIAVDETMRKRIIQYLKSHKAPLISRFKGKAIRVFRKVKASIS